MDQRLVVTLDAGDVEYSLTEAATDIDQIIDALQQAKDEGARYVVGLSGNYRGARYVSISPNYELLVDKGEDF